MHWRILGGALVLLILIGGILFINRPKPQIGAGWTTVGAVIPPSAANRMMAASGTDSPVPVTKGRATIQVHHHRGSTIHSVNTLLDWTSPKGTWNRDWITAAAGPLETVSHDTTVRIGENGTLKLKCLRIRSAIRPKEILGEMNFQESAPATTFLPQNWDSRWKYMAGVIELVFETQGDVSAGRAWVIRDDTDEACILSGGATGDAPGTICIQVPSPFHDRPNHSVLFELFGGPCESIDTTGTPGAAQVLVGFSAHAGDFTYLRDIDDYNYPIKSIIQDSEYKIIRLPWAESAHRYRLGSESGAQTSLAYGFGQLAVIHSPGTKEPPLLRRKLAKRIRIRLPELPGAWPNIGIANRFSWVISMPTAQWHNFDDITTGVLNRRSNCAFESLPGKITWGMYSFHTMNAHAMPARDSLKSLLRHHFLNLPGNDSPPRDVRYDSKTDTFIFMESETGWALRKTDETKATAQQQWEQFLTSW